MVLGIQIHLCAISVAVRSSLHHVILISRHPGPLVCYQRGSPVVAPCDSDIEASRSTSVLSAWQFIRQ